MGSTCFGDRVQQKVLVDKSLFVKLDLRISSSALSKSGLFPCILQKLPDQPCAREPLCLSHRNLDCGVNLFRRQGSAESPCRQVIICELGFENQLSALSKSGLFPCILQKLPDQPCAREPLCLSHRNLDCGVNLFRRQGSAESPCRQVIICELGFENQLSALSKSGLFPCILQKLPDQPCAREPLCLSHRNLDCGVNLFRRQGSAESHCRQVIICELGFENQLSALSKSGLFPCILQKLPDQPCAREPLCLSHRNLDCGVNLFRRQGSAESHMFETVEFVFFFGVDI